MLGSRLRRVATVSSWATAVRCSSESNSGVLIVDVVMIVGPRSGSGERPSLLRRAPRLWSCSCSQPEDRERAPEEIVLIAGAQDTRGIGPVFGLCVQYRLPAD